MSARLGGNSATWPAACLVLVLTVGLVVVPSGIAAKSRRPKGSVSVSHVTAAGATVNALINPEGSSTQYAVWVRVVPECVKEGCEIAYEERVIAEGTVPAGKPRSVRTRAELEPEQPCTVWVEMINASGETVSRKVRFKTKPGRR